MEEDEVDIFTRCPYPKHRGILWEKVIEEDRPYVEFLISGDGPEGIDAGLVDHLTDLLEEVW